MGDEPFNLPTLNAFVLFCVSALSVAEKKLHSGAVLAIIIQTEAQLKQAAPAIILTKNYIPNFL
jgi:hypothetical protein